MITPIGKRSCENCGNIPCARSFVAFHYDECIKSNYKKNWIPKDPKERLEFLRENCACETTE